MNKLSFIKSGLVVIAALVLASCSKSEEFKFNPDSALQIESVSGISPFALMQEPASKAVITGETLPGDEASKGIGLFVTATSGGAYDGKTSGYSNVKYAYSSEKWSATSPIYLSNTIGKLNGYFPYNTDAADLTAIPVESSLNGTDYLYATEQEVSFTKKTVSLTMNHALARLHLTIKKGDKYLSDCSLTKIVLQSNAIDANGTMNITTGAVTAAKAADEIGTFQLTGTDAVTASGIEKDILLVPADNTVGSKDLTLTLTIDGVDAEVKFTGDKGLDIRSGIQNNVTLTIEDIGIKVTGIGVGVWGEGGSQSVEVGGHKVTVKLADGTPASNVMISTYIEGDNVKIKAVSSDGYGLDCSRDDNVAVPEPNVSNGFHTFTISNITKDVVVVIGQITLHFDMNGRKGTSPIEMKVRWGQIIEAPIPKASLSAFCGWYMDEGCTTPYDFSQGIKASVTLYAKWVDGINGHAYVQLAGYMWATENATGGEFNYHTEGVCDNNWGCYFYPQEEAYNVSHSWGSEKDENQVAYSWTFPSQKQWQALMDKCYWEWTFHYSGSFGNGQSGYIVYQAKRDEDKGTFNKSNSGYSPATDTHIFLPAAGQITENDLSRVVGQGNLGNYWTSSDKNSLYFKNSQRVFEMNSYTVRAYSVRPIAE